MKPISLNPSILNRLRLFQVFLFSLKKCIIVTNTPSQTFEILQNGVKNIVVRTSSTFSKTSSKSVTKNVLEILGEVESGSMVRLPEVVVQTDVLKHYIELRVQYKLGRLDEDAGGKAE